MYSFTNVLLCLLPGSVLNRLREMLRFDFVTVREIGNRPHEFQDAMVRARAHLHLLHRRTQKVFSCIIYHTILAHFGGSHIRVHLHFRTGKALALAFACTFHALANFLRWFAETITG